MLLPHDGTSPSGNNQRGLQNPVDFIKSYSLDLVQCRPSQGAQWAIDREDVQWGNWWKGFQWGALLGRAFSGDTGGEGLSVGIGREAFHCGHGWVSLYIMHVTCTVGPGVSTWNPSSPF